MMPEVQQYQIIMDEVFLDSLLTHVQCRPTWG